MTMTSNLDLAVEAIKKRREEWLKNHPKEQQKPICEICRDSGLRMILKDEFGNVYPNSDRYKPGMYEFYEPCSCTKDKVSMVKRNNKNFSTVPGLYADATINNLRKDVYKTVQGMQSIAEARNNAVRYVSAFEEYESAGMGLYIWSRTKGSGKSRLASTISNELTEFGVRNKFASASSILSEIQSSWNDKTVSEAKIISKYIEPRLLIIDDIGAKSGQNWMDEKFFQIIDARYQRNKPTIFTSNYEVERLPFDSRITDRISDIDRFFCIHMPEESVRQVSRSGEKSKFLSIYDDHKKGDNKDGE